MVFLPVSPKNNYGKGKIKIKIHSRAVSQNTAIRETNYKIKSKAGPEWLHA